MLTMSLSKIVQESVNIQPSEEEVKRLWRSDGARIAYVEGYKDAQKKSVSSQISLLEAHKEIIEARIRTLLHDKDTRLEVSVMSKVTELKKLITYLTEQILEIKKTNL